MSEYNSEKYWLEHPETAIYVLEYTISREMSRFIDARRHREWTQEDIDNWAPLRNIHDQAKEILTTFRKADRHKRKINGNTGQPK